MRIAVTTKGNKVVARTGNRQKTLPATGNVAADHGQAARALAAKVAPGYRRNEILNSVKVAEALPGKTVYIYKD